MFASQVGQWFKPGPRRQDVEIGAVFRKVRRGNIIEIARVLDIVPDSMGVPHVHYTVSIESAHQQCFEEKRTLGLTSFAERFTKAVAG
ncbi:MAG: hypothetical protein ACE5GS_01840 [Kiloniellaceae bacterium]